VPFLTPQDLPEGDVCRPLSIPASSEWLALFGGVLTELTKSYNWEYSGGLTVEETLAVMNERINDWYFTACTNCTTPGGYRVIRIGAGGHLEQLNESGDWEDATDEYHIPPPEERTEGTEADQVCLAAKNAVNVLAQLYENLSESFAEELSSDEALVAFIAAAVAIVGFEFAPITWGIAALGFVFFEALFKALEFITADLWTEDFTSQLTCTLQNCAINTDGVVTFDWDCFNDAMNEQANDFGLTDTQLRLYIQVGYILYFIGGGDALNLAGRTTEITNDDCSFCGGSWTYLWDFTLSDGGWVNCSPAGGEAVWVDGQGWQTQDYGHANAYGFYSEGYQWSPAFTIPAGTQITAFVNCFSDTNQSGGDHYEAWIGGDRSEGLSRPMHAYSNLWSMCEETDGEINGSASGQAYMVGLSPVGRQVYIRSAQLSGVGLRPDFTGGEFL